VVSPEVAEAIGDNRCADLPRALRAPTTHSHYDTECMKKTEPDASARISGNDHELLGETQAPL
jgi:hypothetical protein